MNRSLPRYLGPYRLMRRIGQGGMCEVFQAVVYGASGFEKLVAIKTLLPTYQGNPDMERLLIKEATIGAQLRHRNLVQVQDFGAEDGVYYVRMDYISGADLLTLSRHERPSAALALLIASEVALALDFVHRYVDADGRHLGLIHRDVSPSNILISASGEVKLADFGVAKATKLADITQGNIRKGKYAYMSPEQVSSDHLTPQSDQFGLAITLTELLTGHRPFDGGTPLDTMDLIKAAQPDLSGLKRDVEQVVARCLNRAPGDRFPNAGSLYRALARLKRNYPPAGPPALGAWVRKLTTTDDFPNA